MQVKARVQRGAVLHQESPAASAALWNKRTACVLFVYFQKRMIQVSETDKLIMLETDG